jgi:hypothetical protein
MLSSEICKQSRLVLSAKERWTQGRALGSEEDKIREYGLFRLSRRGKKLSSYFTGLNFDVNIGITPRGALSAQRGIWILTEHLF